MVVAQLRATLYIGTVSHILLTNRRGYFTRPLRRTSLFVCLSDHNGNGITCKTCPHFFFILSFVSSPLLQNTLLGRHLHSRCSTCCTSRRRRKSWRRGLSVQHCSTLWWKVLLKKKQLGHQGEIRFVFHGSENEEILTWFEAIDCFIDQLSTQFNST